MIRLQIEDITANALILQISADPKQRFVSYKALDAYSDAVANILKKQGESVNNSYWNVHTIRMLDLYCDFFEECELNGHLGILLKPNKTIANLKEQFCGYSLKLLNAYKDDQAVKSLLKANKE